MSRRRPPWSSLGIDPTSDERAIKRAYAKKLKEIDVEAEPAKFIALRARLEEALWQAQWVRDVEDADDEAEEAADSGTAWEDAPGDAGIIEAVVPGAPREPAPLAAKPQAHANPWGVPEVDPVEARFAAIEALLEKGGAGRDAALDRELRALWAEPALETVDAAEDAERRLAHLALDHGVAAAFLLRLASWHYGWARRAQLVATDWPVREVGQRAAAENWIARVEKGEVPGQAQMVIGELREPPSGRWWTDYFPKRRIAAFLTELRRRFPEGEYRFDEDVVAAWDAIDNPAFSWSSLFLLIPLGWGLLLLFTNKSLQGGWSNPAFWIFIAAAVACLVGWRWALDRLRPKQPVRYGGPLARGQLAALAALLGLFAAATQVPVGLAAGIALAAAATALMLLAGTMLPAEKERDPLLLALFNARYLLIAAGLFTYAALREETPRWATAIAPGLIAALALHLLRERLVATWEAMPAGLLIGVRAALLAAAGGLFLIGVTTLPAYPDWAVLAAIVLLMVQDAAGNAWRQPLTTQFYIAYIGLIAVLAVLPLPAAMALVGRRLGDRLFAKG
ncbi:MAG: hypothetical protein JNL35_04825 [Sphingopyxis sp.]|nr:hypothetical protein [Sphingopyxis sp.]